MPAFFFLAGFLYYATCDGTMQCHLRKIGNRLRSLAVPYLLWNFIGYLMLAYAVPMVAKSDFLRSFWSVRVAYRLEAAAPVDGPLYFIKGLMFLTLGAPVLHILLRHSVLAAMTLASVGFWAASPVAALSGKMSVVALAMFSLGGYMAVQKPQLMERIVTSRLVALAALAVFFAIAAGNLLLHLRGGDSPAMLRLGILAGIPLWLALGGTLSRGSCAYALGRLQGFAMFLFCSFDLIMAAGRNYWRILRVRNDATCLVVAAATLGVSLLAYCALGYVAPPLLRLLIGNRQRNRQNADVVE